jgi:hypothetical protein
VKVRLHAVYVFRPTGYDRLLTQHYTATADQRVRVVQLPGAPPPNTMGHAHIADAETGAFLGLVSTASLVRPS